jgi:general secretion pathway protein L
MESKSMLYVWMPEGAAAWRWRTADQDWQSAAQWEQLLQATASLNIKDVTVFFPTTSAQVVRLPMTRLRLRQLGQTGIRYLLEEHVLGSVEQFELRYVHHADDTMTLLAMPQELIAHYLNILALGNWNIQALLPDFLLIPYHAEQVSLWSDPQTQLLRIDEHWAVVAEDVAITLARLPNIQTVNLYGAVDASVEQELADLMLTTHHHPATSLWLTNTVRHAFNMLPKRQESLISPYWRTVAAVVCFGIVVQISHDVLATWRYGQVAMQTKAQAEQQFKQWFPEETRIVNLKRQVEAHLKPTGGGDMVALSLLSRVGPALQQAQLVAQAVRYQNDQLELDITASNLAILESLRQQLNQQGLKAELGSVNPVGSEVSGLIKVQP